MKYVIKYVMMFLVIMSTEVFGSIENDLDSNNFRSQKLIIAKSNDIETQLIGPFPNEIWENIINKLQIDETLNFRAVCKEFKKMVKHLPYKNGNICLTYEDIINIKENDKYKKVYEDLKICRIRFISNEPKNNAGQWSSDSIYKILDLINSMEKYSIIKKNVLSLNFRSFDFVLADPNFNYNLKWTKENSICEKINEENQQKLKSFGEFLEKHFLSFTLSGVGWSLQYIVLEASIGNLLYSPAIYDHKSIIHAFFENNILDKDNKHYKSIYYWLTGIAHELKEKLYKL